ncbi:MAG: OstA-like protein [Ferruginibacter sp.]
MYQLNRLYKYFTLLFFFCCLGQAYAQMPQDTTRIIEIISSKKLRQQTIDSNTTLKMLIGNAIVKQGNTTLYGDSIALNQLTTIAEVFGNVHINDNDSINTYSQYLKYVGKERIAYLKKNVKLTDGKATLYTDDLVYNLATGVATYKNGGRVVNGKTVLTSSDAVYYSDTKDVYFKKYVHLVDPKYDIVADSLLYNTETKIATFISPTRIVNKDGAVIRTKSGTYNLQTGEALFYDRTNYADSTRSVTGNKLAYDEKSGVLQVEGNGKIVDSVNRVIMIGDQILIDKKTGTFLGTRKPVMIIYRDNDSTYVAADTLFSGLRKYDSSSKKTVVVNDTLTKTMSVNVSTSTSDSIRYFLGFHNVKIFNDSLQAVGDSMYYSTEDSVFRLFYDPVFWNNKSQVSGDTMYLFTEKQQPKRLYVFTNGMMINKENEAMYDQIAGRTINAYFKDGNIDYVRVKGSPAESIYYPIDDDSAYVGMNRTKGDVIDVYFLNKALNRVKYFNNVDGTMYPLKQTPSDQKLLKGFKWMDNRRPKNKLQLFE